jgi:transcriptional regulator with XRE-family HTH domain
MCILLIYIIIIDILLGIVLLLVLLNTVIVLLMSPFASALHSLRMEHNICQAELAAMVGYEQTYISALEVRSKGPPTEAFVKKLISVLNITGDERECLLEAANASSRKLVINTNMPQDVYWLLRDLKNHLHDLSPAQIQIVRQVLALKDSIDEKPPNEMNRIKRRKKMEANM